MLLLLLSCAWIGGVGAGVLGPGGAPARVALALGLAGAALVTLALGWTDRRTRLGAAVGLIALLGLARAWAALPPDAPPPGSLRSYNVPAAAAQAAPEVAVRGVVREEPYLNNTHTGLLIRVDAADLERAGAWQPAPGGLLVLAGRFTPAHQGDRISATGVLQEAPTFRDFDYRAYLLRQDLGSYMRQARVQVLEPGAASDMLTPLVDLRRAAGAWLAQALPEPQAGLARGILLGDGHALDPTVRDAFGATGTAQIVVVSGNNVTLVIAVVFFLLHRRLRLSWAVACAIAMIILYTLFVGAGSSVVRAAIMGGLYLVARVLGRPAHGLTLLGAAAWLMTLWNPLLLLDVSFQLSFAAMVGLILLAPRLLERWQRVPPGLREMLAVSVAAWLFTAPLIAFYFDIISPIGMLANLLLEPLLAPIMVLGYAALILGLLWTLLGQAVAWLAWVPLSAMIAVVTQVARMPGAGLPLPDFSIWGVLAWYAGLALLLALTEPEQRWRARAVKQWHHLPTRAWRWPAR